MLFNSLAFLLFFPIVVFLYWILPHRYRNAMLLIASSYLKMELVCNILAGSKIVITNAEGKTMTLEESGVYHVRPIGGAFQMYKIKDSGYEFIEFK